VAGVLIEPHWIVAPPGTPTKLGAVVSTTVINWVAATLLPQSSLADQTREMMDGHAPFVVAMKLTGTDTSHASVAVTVAGELIELQSFVAFAGTPTRLGAAVSTTVTNCVAATLFPQSSLADQTREIIDGHAPFVVALKLTGTDASQASVAVTVAGELIELQSFVASSGTPTRVGAVTSRVQVEIAELVTPKPKASPVATTRLLSVETVTANT
jgi:hypothetical protein